MKLVIAISALSLAAACASAASTASPTAAAAASSAKCSEPERRQLDFWVGDWDVFNTADGVQYATSKIESINGGCGVSEAYSSPKAPGGAYYGKSYSSFDRNDGKWHQFYVDSKGNATWYTGGLEADGALTMTAPGKSGSTQKMSYVPQADGSVRQIGAFSTDGGKTWNAGYDYTYRKRK
jgi:hypothetical protein